MPEDRLHLETQKREAGKTRLPGQIAKPVRSVAGYLTNACYLTIDCVEYSDAGSLPTLPRSST
jgi:hypothetical protein